LHPAITWRRHKALHRAFLGLGILRASSAASGRRALRTRSFAGWCAAGARWAAGTRWSKSGPCAKSRTRSGRSRSASSGITASGASGMLGARAASELACAGRSAGSALRIAARAARRAVAVEDWSAALNSSSGDSGIGLDRSLNHGWRLVERTRPGLRHHHAPGGQRGRGRRSVRVAFSAMSGRRRRRGIRSHYSNFGGRFRLGLSGVGFDNRWGRNHGRLGCFGGGSRRNRRCVNLSLGRRRWSFRNCNRWCDWSHRRLDDHGNCGRRYGDGRTRRNCRACRSLGDYRVGRRACGNGGRSWRTNDNRRRGTGQGNDLARFRLGGRSGRPRNRNNRRRWRSWRLGGLRHRMPLRHTALPGLFFLFLFLGQNGLQHVAGLGDMR